MSGSSNKKSYVAIFLRTHGIPLDATKYRNYFEKLLIARGLLINKQVTEDEKYAIWQITTDEETFYQERHILKHVSLIPPKTAHSRIKGTKGMIDSGYREKLVPSERVMVITAMLNNIRLDQPIPSLPKFQTTKPLRE
jgi:hypothetical protein